MEKQKAELKDKVVRIEIILLLGEPSDLLGNGTQRYIVEDSSNGVAPYGQVALPREGLEKIGLAKDPHREGPFIIYARVHVLPEKNGRRDLRRGRNARRGRKRESDLFLVSRR